MFRKDAIVAATLLLTAFAVYWPVFDGSFLLWGDVYQLPRNPFILTRDLKALWTAPYLGLFTPVSHSVWYFVWTFVSESPSTFHLLNVLIHVANANLVFWLLQRRSLPFWSTFICSLIFLLHPLLSESICWISEMRTLLATFFTLVAMHFFLNRHRLAAVLALTFFSLSILSKPIFVFAPLALLFDFLLGEKERKVNHAPFVWSALFGLAVAALIGWNTLAKQVAFDFDWLSRVIRMIDSMGWFVQKFFWPIGILTDYSRSIGSIVSNASWIVGLVVIIAGTGLLYFLGRKDPRVRLGWLMFLAAWLPFSGLFHFGDLDFSTVANRYAYGMAVGTTMILGCLFDRLGRLAGRSPLFQAAASVVVLAVASSYGFLSFQNSRFWVKDEVLFADLLEDNPSSFIGHNYLGRALIDRGNLKEGILHLETARKLKPEHPGPLLGLLLAKSRAHDHSEVVRLGGSFLTNPAALAAANQSPLMFEILSTLGYSLASVGKVAEAQKILCHALQTSPMGRIDRSTQNNLRSVEDLMTDAQKSFQPCRF